MKRIFICILIMSFSLNFVGCKCKPEPAQPEKPIIEIPVLRPDILKILEKEGRWEVTLNAVAKEMVQKGIAEVRLHIGYCWYAGELKESKVVFNPDWHPGGRVSVGLWSNGKYLTSSLVEKDRAKMSPIFPTDKVQPSVVKTFELSLVSDNLVSDTDTNCICRECGRKCGTGHSKTCSDYQNVSEAFDSLQDVWREK